MSVPRAPIVDARDRDRLLAALRERMPGYVPEWRPADGGPVSALMQVFARYLEIFVEGLNQVPDRSLLSFLDMLGVQLLPAQAGRAPLVFEVMPTSPVDVTLPALSQVAARVQPPSPSLLAPQTQPSTPPSPPLFYTAHAITLARARLTTLYSVDSGSDAFVDHSGGLSAGFTLFDHLGPVDHLLYLGHDALFALAGAAEIALSFDMGASAADGGDRRSVVLEWEYLSKDGWLPLVVAEDTTARFTQDGRIVLKKDCGPDAKEDVVDGHTSYWIRARVSARPPGGTIAAVQGAEITLDTAMQLLAGDVVTVDGEDGATVLSILGNRLTLDRAPAEAAPERRLALADGLPPLRPQGADAAGLLPAVDGIRAKVGFTKAGLAPEKAFTDTAPLDTENNFYPFGRQPAAYTTFYLGSKEVFQRRGARVQIDAALSEKGVASASPALALAFEYHTGSEWRRLDNPLYKFLDDTDRLTRDGGITFLCPPDWGETEVNGEANHWMRARIDAGDYGHPLQLTVNTSLDLATVESEPSTLAPPVVGELTLQYTYFTNPELLDHCLTYNDFVFEDHSEDCRWPRRLFSPFLPIADRQPAVHFGFDAPLPSGLISLFLDVVPSEAAGDDADASASPFVWEYRSARGWTELGVLDETRGFRGSGMVQFIGPPDAVPATGLGGDLYRIRARLKQGERLQPAPVAAVWLNAVWGLQGQSVARDILGTGDGNPGQALRFVPTRVPVLTGETIEIREWAGRGEDWSTAVAGVPEGDLRFEHDPVTNTPTALWVRWYERPHLYDSGPEDRHYVIERATGVLRFGDGRRGMLPPAGSRISASYATGGGLAGNVPAGAIAELRTAVPYLQSVTNPAAATGGAATETLPAVRQRGPQRLRHRDRGVSASDCEWLAREASPDVAQARCLPITGPDGSPQRGWVTLLVVPQGADAQPQPTPELQRRVQSFLAARVPATVAGRVRVLGAEYAPVGVVAEIVPTEPQEAAQVEALVRDGLNRFLHPLTGGPDGQGWSFGQPVYQSQIAVLIESTPGVDYAARIGLRVNGATFDEVVPVGANALAAPGDHELKLTLGAR